MPKENTQPPHFLGGPHTLCYNHQQVVDHGRELPWAAVHLRPPSPWLKVSLGG